MFLALKELSHSRFKYILVGSILAAILFLLFFINGLAKGLALGDSSSLKNLPADYVVMNEEAEGDIRKSEIGPEDKETLARHMEGTDWMPLTIQFSSVKKGTQKTDVAYFVTNRKAAGLPPVIEGKGFRDLHDNEVIVNDSIKNKGYELNDILKDEELGAEFRIAGFFEDQTYNHMPVVYADRQYWAEKELAGTDRVNAVLYVGEQREIAGFDVLTKKETVNAMPGYSETQGSLMMMISFLFFISAFVSTVFFYVITIQKTNQFGILKAVGANTRFIAKSIIFQVILITAGGYLFSLLAIAGISQVLPPDMPFELSAELILRTGAIFMALNLAGSLISVYKVSKADALEAMGRVE
jgi:putative ABC transport system permease protein